VNLTLSAIWLVSVGLAYFMGYGRGYRKGLAITVSLAVMDFFKGDDK
jgi:hypothetical protein